MKMLNVRQIYLLFILIIGVFAITGCGSGGESGHWNPAPTDTTAPADPAVPTDATAPTVIAVVPVNGATGVALNQNITAAFSEDMDPATISDSTFTLVNTTLGGTVVSGVVTYSVASRTATFDPTNTFASSTVYTATVTTGAKDLAGNALAASKVWSFTTGATLDVTAPTVILTVPADGATDVATNTAITATFSEDMDPATISGSTFTLVNTTLSGIAITGSVSYAVVGRTATFTPTTPATLPANTLFTATITTGAKDLAGNPLATNKVWTFTTSMALDATAPTVTLTSPVHEATDVALNKTVSATFSEAMNPLTITTDTVTLAVTSGASVTGVVAYDPLTNIVTFDPETDLASGTNYTATITSGAKDLAGNALVVPAVGGLPKPNPWTFTTGGVLAPTGVDLNSAASFGTFGGTAGMTNQGTLTQINGDIGTTATDTSAVTGFHDTAGDIYTETGSNIGAVNGTIYTCTVSTIGPTSAVVNAAYCALATQARLDAVDAYNELALMPSDGVLAGNLAGTTINPGVYTNSSSVMIEGGDLTLDALGDANAVFVFQIGSTLTVGGPGAAFPQSIILAGGAQAKNVFWQVGTAATINAGGGGTMVGTIIAQDGVSFSTAGNVAIVTLNGRALSLGASVTMVNTVINVPAP